MAFCKDCGKQLEYEAISCVSCQTAVAADNTAGLGGGDVYGIPNAYGEKKSFNYDLSFKGDSWTLFKIWIVNLLLTMVTLGIYSPWARAKMKRYLYSSTYVGDYSFEFHGTGKQMFIGALKVAFIAFLINIALRVFSAIDGLMSLILLLAIMVSYFALLGLFIHGARRFRMSRTSYRGIRFGYRGEKKPLIIMVLSTLIPFYYPVFINNLREYIYRNTRFGNAEAEFTGNSKDYFWMYWGNLFLVFVTLGIYYPWYKKKMFNYFWGNLSLKKDNTFIGVTAKATAGKYFSLIIGNFFIVLCTLGLGFPIAKVRSARFVTDNLELTGNVDLDTVIQTEQNYVDALGDAGVDMDDTADFFDIDIF